jgi:hypothetical protein
MADYYTFSKIKPEKVKMIVTELFKIRSTLSIPIFVQ